jgi:peptide-methionine (S)-S-oxide reductase
MVLQSKEIRAALLGGLILFGLAVQCGEARAAETRSLTVAGGCFWCVEADFESVDGVSEVVSGYTGGTVEDPTYEQVTGGGTGHYEAARIHYDPERVMMQQIYHMFFRSIDPTDAGGQFCDRGNSYRSAIFVETPAQRTAAQKAKTRAEEALGQEIVTPILEAGPFYKAEAYHQDYYKSEKRIPVSSVGLFVTREDAYKRYREGCRRDERVKELWGADAPFVGS